MHANNLIEFRPTHRGSILTLPRRELGTIKRIGWLPLLLGLFPLLFGLNWCASILEVFQGGGAPAGFMQVFLIAFAAVGLVPMWFGLKIFSLGIAILRNQTYASIEVTDKNLICYESFYGFSFKRKIPALHIKQLVVCPLLELFSNPNNGADVEPESDSSTKIPAFIQELFSDDLRVLATSEKMGKCILAAYPERMVIESATLLCKELDDVQFRLPSALGTSGAADTSSTSNGPVTIVNATQSDPREPSGLHSNLQQFASSSDAAEKNPQGETSTQTSVQTLTEPPAGSQLKVTQQEGTDVYEVPAQGWRKAKSLVMFAVFWNTFMLFFSGVTIWGMLHAPQVGLWEIVGLIAFEGIFWAVGIGLAIWAWDMATRSAMIGVAGEQMFIETKSSFGTKWVEFNQSKIHSISVQNSGTSVNDVPVKHLLVETEDQPPVGLFANLDDEELHWLAGRLKSSLNFKWKNRLDISTAFNDDGDIIVPEKTRLAVDRRRGQTTVEVPAATLGKRLQGLIFFIVALVIATVLTWFLVQQEDLGAIAFSLLFGGVFVAIGIFGLLYSSRRWTVVVSPEQLTITRRWPLGTKQMTFARNDIKNICIGTNGLKTGNQTHYRLVVHTQKKKKAMTLMGSWSVKELKYVAATIYEGLEMVPTTISQGDS